MGYWLQLALLPKALRAFASDSGEAVAVAGLSAGDRAMLAAATNLILPASDGMPSASGVGGVTYLEALMWQYSDISDQISQFLKELAQTSASQFRGKFTELRFDQRIAVLKSVEKAESSTFSTFVGYVYESYYTNPRVLSLIACAPLSIPSVDDEVLLAPVKKLKHLYREVP